MNTKERIFETALDLFAEQGFKATSIREITGKTGLSVASFYNHFKSKNELLQSIYDYYTGLYNIGRDTEIEYGKLLEQMGPFQLFEQMNNQIIESLLNEKLVKLTRIIINEQYTNKTAGEIAFKDRQLLLSSMEALFCAMKSRGMIQAEEPGALGKLFGYIYLGFSAENIYYSILGNKDPHEIVNAQSELIQSLLREFVAPGFD